MPVPARETLAVGLIVIGLVGRPAWGGAMRGDNNQASPVPPAGLTLAETNAGAQASALTPGPDPTAARPQAGRGLRFQFRPVGIVPIGGNDGKTDPKPAPDNAAGATTTSPAGPGSTSAPAPILSQPTSASDAVAAMRAAIKPGDPQLAVSGDPRPSTGGGLTGLTNPFTASSSNSNSTASLPGSSSTTSSTTSSPTTLYSTPSTASGTSSSSTGSSAPSLGTSSSTTSSGSSSSSTSSGAALAASTNSAVGSSAPLSLATTNGSSPSGASTTASPISTSGSSGGVAASSGGVAASAMARAASVSATPTAVADAYVNFSGGPYPDAANLLTGSPKAWTTSPVVTRVFGGSAPSIQDQAAFEAKVASTVTDTYKQAGVPIRVTTDPGVPAAHTLSVVSGATATASPTALGIASVGYNGFTLIDQFAPAQDPTDLATAVGHNVAHELMHAFGVSDHPEATGDAVDAATTSWSSLTDPNASFSQPAANLLSTLDLDATGSMIASNPAIGTHADGAQQIDPVTVPEPGAVVVWLAAGAVGMVVARRRLR